MSATSTSISISLSLTVSFSSPPFLIAIVCAEASPGSQDFIFRFVFSSLHISFCISPFSLFSLSGRGLEPAIQEPLGGPGQTRGGITGSVEWRGGVGCRKRDSSSTLDTKRERETTNQIPFLIYGSTHRLVLLCSALFRTPFTPCSRWRRKKVRPVARCMDQTASNRPACYIILLTPMPCDSSTNN